jgi:hypothetical protein
MSPAPELTSAPTRWPAPWIFSVLILPQGVYLGFVTTPLPFLLAKASVPVDTVARITSLLSLPWIFYFLWAPLVDWKLRRGSWLIVGASLSAACVSSGLWLAKGANISLVEIFGLGGAVSASLVLAACGGIMLKTLSAPSQAKASAWYEAGKLAASALGGALMLWLAEHWSPLSASLITFILIASPAFAVLTIVDPRPLLATRFSGHISEVVREVRTLLGSRAKRWSILLLASPLGTGAGIALLPAIASKYGVDSNGVVWINGVAGGIVLALGSLCGVLLPGEWDRRVTYAAGGFASALAAVSLLASKQAPVYLIGTIFYLCATGFCWARYAALVAEVVGPAGQALSARYSVVGAVGNIPLACMIFADGVGYKHFGTRGLLLTDAAGNLLVVAVVAWVVFHAGKSLRSPPSA